jgi:hypothetical protein
MKFREDRPFAGVDAAVKKLLEIANRLGPDHAGRIHIGAINALFMTDRSRLHDHASVGRVSVVHPSRSGFVRVAK